MSTSHLDTDILHRYLLEGGLRPDDHEEAQRHLDECPRCRERMAGIRQDVSDFETRFLESTLESVQGRLATAPRRWKGWATAGAFVVAATVLVAIFVGKPERPSPYAARGGPTLSVLVKRGQSVSTIRSGEPLYAGDQLRLVAQADGCAYLFLFAENAKGERIPLAAQPTHLGAGRNELPLAFALESEDDLVRLHGVFSVERLSRVQAEQRIPAGDRACPTVTWNFGRERRE